VNEGGLDPGSEHLKQRAHCRVIQCETVAAHLADLIRRAQADGGIRPDADPEAAAWLVLSVLSARRLRADTMPDADRLEAGVTALTLQALAERTASTPAHTPEG
jgi:AcrR family transcriptional regulator